MSSWPSVCLLRKYKEQFILQICIKRQIFWNSFLLDLTVDILKGGGVNRLFIELLLYVKIESFLGPRKKV